MAVTPIGWLLLVAGPIMMLVQPRWLYIATLFFLPFTATGVMNVGNGPDASAIQVSMYLGSLLIVRRVAEFIRKGRLPFPREERTSLVWLGLFIATTAVSLIMPLLLGGKLLIPGERLNDQAGHLLRLSSHNITGVMYMVYGFLLTYVIAVMNRNPAMLRLSLKSFMAGSVFSALWAVVELVCKMSGIPYPSVVFNTGTAGSTMGFKQFLSESVFRLSSVAVEPSIFAQALLVAISLYLPFVFGHNKLFGRVIDKWLFGLLFVVLFLTTSSTAYVGIVVAALIMFWLFIKKGLLKLKYIFYAVAAFATVAVLYVLVPSVQWVLGTVLLSKGSSFSALERLMTIQNSWQMFLRYPILGIGWESIASHDLIVHILANAGAIGLLLFTAAIYSVFRGLYRSIKSRNSYRQLKRLMQMDIAMYLAFAITLFTSAISGFLNVFSFFWFTWGLAIAVTEQNGMPRGLIVNKFYEPIRTSQLPDMTSL